MGEVLEVTALAGGWGGKLTAVVLRSDSDLLLDEALTESGAVLEWLISVSSGVELSSMCSPLLAWSIDNAKWDIWLAVSWLLLFVLSVRLLFRDSVLYKSASKWHKCINHNRQQTEKVHSLHCAIIKQLLYYWLHSNSKLMFSKITKCYLHAHTLVTNSLNKPMSFGITITNNTNWTSASNTKQTQWKTMW